MLLASSLVPVRRQWAQALEGRFRTVPAGDGVALNAAVATLKPAVLLLDAGFPSLRRMEDLRTIRHASSETAIIVLANPPRDDQALSVLRMGARGYCATGVPAALLRRAVEKVRAGELWVSRRVIGRILEAVASFAPSADAATPIEAGLASLSRRQREVTLLVAQGHSNRSIAAKLAISEATVKAHLTTIFQKLGGPTRVELALHIASSTRRAAPRP